MPSPFPGMDPWLEDEEVFPDLHESLSVLPARGAQRRDAAGVRGPRAKQGLDG